MQQEGYLEESVAMDDEARATGKTKYTMFNILSWFSLVSAIIGFFIVMMTQFTLWIMLIPTVLFGVGYVFFHMKKDKYLFECDYIFVTGSIRIAKILNGKHRKALAVVDCKDIEAIGKYDSEKFLNYANMPGIKKVIATPNVGFHDDKIFYCYYPGNGQKNLLIFEPSNLMLLNVTKSGKKNILNV